MLFVIHYVLNRRWFGVLLKGKYTPFRIWHTVLAVSVLLSMVGGVIPVTFYPFYQLMEETPFERKLHMLSAYWGFVLMSLHLGLHWNMMLGKQ